MDLLLGSAPRSAGSPELILPSGLLLCVRRGPPERAGRLFAVLLSPVLLLSAWVSDTCFLQPLPYPPACLCQNPSKVGVVVSYSFSVIALPWFVMITCFSFSLNESVAHICVSGFPSCLSQGGVTKLLVALDLSRRLHLCAPCFH